MIFNDVFLNFKRPIYNFMNLELLHINLSLEHNLPGEDGHTFSGKSESEVCFWDVGQSVFESNDLIIIRVFGLCYVVFDAYISIFPTYQIKAVSSER